MVKRTVLLAVAAMAAGASWLTFQGLGQWPPGPTVGFAALLLVTIVLTLRRGGAVWANIVDWVGWVAAPAAGVIAGLLGWRASGGSILPALLLCGYAGLGAWFMVRMYARQKRARLEASLGGACPAACPRLGPEMPRGALWLVAMFAVMTAAGLGIAATQISTSSCPGSVDRDSYFGRDHFDLDGYLLACRHAREEESGRAWRFSSISVLGLAGAAVTLKRGGARASNFRRWMSWVIVPFNATFLVFQLSRSTEFALIAVPGALILWGLFVVVAFPGALQRRRFLMLVAAVALLVGAVSLTMSATSDSDRFTPNSPAAANLPDRPPAIEGSVYGLVKDRQACGGSEMCQQWAARLDLSTRTVAPAASSPSRGPYLKSVQFTDGQLWGLALAKEIGKQEPGVGIGPVTGSEVPPIAELGGVSDEVAYGFAVSDQGKIAWTGRAQHRRFIYEFDPATKAVREISTRDAKASGDRSRPSMFVEMAGLAYGPAGQLAVAETDGSLMQLRIVASSGRTRTIKLGALDVREHERLGFLNSGPTVTWSKTGLIAVSDSTVALGRGDTYIVDALAGKLVRIIEHAHAQAWSPDGTGILVVRSKTGRDGRLSVVYGPGLAKEKDLGALPDAVTLRSWVTPETPI